MHFPCSLAFIYHLLDPGYYCGWEVIIMIDVWWKLEWLCQVSLTETWFQPACRILLRFRSNCLWWWIETLGLNEMQSWHEDDCFLSTGFGTLPFFIIFLSVTGCIAFNFAHAQTECKIVMNWVLHLEWNWYFWSEFFANLIYASTHSRLGGGWW